MEGPVEHVGTVPVAPLVGAEQVEIALVVDDDGVGGGPVAAPSREALVGRIAIIEVGGVAVGFLLRKYAVEASDEKEEEGEFFHGEIFYSPLINFLS